MVSRPSHGVVLGIEILDSKLEFHCYGLADLRLQNSFEHRIYWDLLDFTTIYNAHVQ